MGFLNVFSNFMGDLLKSCAKLSGVSGPTNFSLSHFAGKPAGQGLDKLKFAGLYLSIKVLFEPLRDPLAKLVRRLQDFSRL